MLPIQEYIDHFKALWESSPDDLPDFPKQYTHDDKTVREKNYATFENEMKVRQNLKDVQQLKKDPGKAFFPLLKSLLQNVFDFEQNHLNLILSDEFKDVSKDFFYKARAFAPELRPENIYQGMRNVWIMNGIQLMLNLPVQITPSVFAYSMIYPYSDNFLDDPEISGAEKAIFSRRFNRRLHGEKVMPASFTETQLYKLVAMFEEEFPRESFPKVFESLYAIQKGQTDSLQLDVNKGLDDAAILRICFEKGGASVLADGYLVAGELSRQQEQALFGYGVYLQLLDDIQDVNEDVQAFTRTLFSCLPKQDFGNLVNQTIHFGRATLAELSCFAGAQNEGFIELMNRSIENMIIESVGVNHSRYTAQYVDELEQFSPLHFDFIRQKRAQSKSQRMVLFQKYFDATQPKSTSPAGVNL